MLNRVRDLLFPPPRREVEALSVESRPLTGEFRAELVDRPIELSMAGRTLRLFPEYRLNGGARLSQNWLLIEGDRYFTEVAEFARLEPGQRLGLRADTELGQASRGAPLPGKRRQLEIENSGGRISLRRLSGTGQAFVRYVDDPAVIARPLAMRLDNLKRLRRIMRGPISLAQPDQALAVADQVNAILQSESYRPIDAHGQPGGLIDLPDSLTPIIVGDLHARVDNLLKILSEGGLLSALAHGQACLILLGDALHPEDDNELEQMDTSLLMVDLFFRLKIAFPNNVFYLRGNHDSFDERVGKAGVPQGILLRNRARELRGEGYVAALAEFFDLLPCVIRARDFIACHGGPPRGRATLQEVIDIRMHPSLAEQLSWNRVRRPGHTTGYSERDVRAFKRALNVTMETPLIVGHTPLSAEGTLWLDAGGIANHHILYSARARRLATFIRANDRMIPLEYSGEPLLGFTNALCVDDEPEAAQGG